MRRSVGPFFALVGLAVAVAGCSLLVSLDGLGPQDGGGVGGDSGGGDAAPEASSTLACDPAKPFTSLVPMAELNDVHDEFKQSLTTDELELWYGTTVPAGDAGSAAHVMHAVRASRTDAFGTPTLEQGVDPNHPVDPGVTGDGLVLYFSGSGGGSGYDLFEATRQAPGDAFGTGFQLPALLQSPTTDVAPFPAADGSLYFVSARGGSLSVWRAGAGDAGLGAPMPVPDLSSPEDDDGVVISSDGLWAYVSSRRTDLASAGKADIFLAHRDSTAEAFGPLSNAMELNSASDERANWLSADGCRLYMESNRNGQLDLFVAEKAP